MIAILLICILVPVVVGLSISLISAKQNAVKLKTRLAQEREVEEINRRRAAAEGFYDSVIEADITNNRIIGELSKELTSQLALAENATYSQYIKAMAEIKVKQQYQEDYSERLDRANLISKYEAKEKAFTIEFEEWQSDEYYRWTRINVCIYYSETDNAIKIIGYVKNIQDEKEKEILLMREANTDYLTGLYNMRAAAQLAYELLNKSAEDESNKKHALMIADIDHFKQVNDTVGHANGDKILNLVARAIFNNMQQTDIVARIGGDEFMVMMHDVTTEYAAEAAYKLTELVARLDTQDFKSIPLSLSVGIAIYPDHSDNYADLFNKADEALYQAKQDGRNTSRLYGTY